VSYVFKKHYTERFEIEKVKRNFMKYRAFSNVRRDIPDCELCDKEFKGEDNTNLAFVKAKHNKLICDECASKVLSEGAEEVSW
jgi:hypothetical protein